MVIYHMNSIVHCLQTGHLSFPTNRFFYSKTWFEEGRSHKPLQRIKKEGRRAIAGFEIHRKERKFGENFKKYMNPK